MTVKELIEELKKQEQTKAVIFFNDGIYRTVDKVKSDNSLRVLIISEE